MQRDNFANRLKRATSGARFKWGNAVIDTAAGFIFPPRKRLDHMRIVSDTLVRCARFAGIGNEQTYSGIASSGKK